ncbi:hypothetical protein CORC01_07455 [Colletotrichum orchidophilum]|uniref:MACPF domain-containing protein n=1 Tax=Colletotrichum orchidophilum TaxID=1209926 RepID=A0A1G4B704_9PEZI|nr:uncharacterized protein CORC01_07455 [Colletotrichum orchidophilum]OHE97201.1 hypothetical protein CORC01_07455 [Colletotrichum orchidophilum]
MRLSHSETNDGKESIQAVSDTETLPRAWSTIILFSYFLSTSSLRLLGMEGVYITPPSSAGAKTFSDATKKPPDSGIIITFQRIDKAIIASNTDEEANKTSVPGLGSSVGTIGLAVLLKKCGISANVGMDDVSMAMIKEGMIAIGLAKEFDFWSSPSSRLLDDDLTLLEYVDHVSKLTKEPELDVRIYYGLKKDHDQQTIQDIYKSGNFVIKVVQIKKDKTQAVQSFRVMKSRPEDASSDILVLITKHQFCLPDETPLPDTTAFGEYVDLLDEVCPYEDSVPSITLRFRDASSLIDESKSNPALAASGGNKQAPKSESSSSPSSLDELQWNLVMKNCQVMHGWYLEPATNEIKMAPKPAFRLRPGLNLGYMYTSDGAVNVQKAMGAAAIDAIPNYGVTDGSKIDVVTVESDIRHSLVRNSFDKSSMDSKIAIGYSGLGVNMSVGSSLDSQRGKSSENKKSIKNMIGRYKLPRVTLFLNADDLVPTQEFIDNVEKIKGQEHTDPTDVRKFYERFGQFFCHEVILGGMLVSTKTLVGNETLEEEQERIGFKHAIGLSVSSPVKVVLGAESKKESTSGNDQSANRSYRDSNDSVVFEARSDMKLILDSLVESGNPQYHSAATVFNPTPHVPVSKFIDIPKSAKIITQFRFKTKSTNKETTHYLRHDIQKLVELKSTGERMVMPEKFQGPRVEPYESEWDDQDGIWTIAPVLNARVCCQGRSQLVDGSMVTIRSGRDTQRFLSVLRTSSGIFLPCITTSEQFIWRVRDVSLPKSLKTAIAGKSSSNPLRHDASLCLTFEFADNPRGFRDFKDDVRGFRNVDYPFKTRLVLVESLSKTVIWPDRRVLLLADGDDLLSNSTTTRIMDLDDAEISVRTAKFNIDVRDPRDDDYDILLEEGNSIEERLKEQQKKLKTRDQGVSG